MTIPTNDNDSSFQADVRLAVGPSTYSQGGYVHFGCYGSGEIALEVIDEQAESQYVATVSLVPYGAPHPGEDALWLKTWFENDGVPKALADAGIVTLTGRRYCTGFGVAEHAELTERARAALDAKRNGMMAAAHREIEELQKLGLIASDRAEQLKRALTSEAIKQHDEDGMSIREMVDMYRDLTESR